MYNQKPWHFFVRNSLENGSADCYNIFLLFLLKYFAEQLRPYSLSIIFNNKEECNGHSILWVPNVRNRVLFTWNKNLRKMVNEIITLTMNDAFLLSNNLFYKICHYNFCDTVSLTVIEI